MLLQTDGSRHDWLEGRGPWLTLVGAVDDATGKIPYALFRDEEDAQSYFLLLRQIVTSHGIPVALYHDRHGIFERSKGMPESLEEQLEGKRKPTQFGRLMEELGITSISPRSPKLNGHVERAQRTHTEELYEVTDTNLEIPELNQALLKWENVYNTIRPHQALGYLTPQQFLKQYQQNKRKGVRCH